MNHQAHRTVAEAERRGDHDHAQQHAEEDLDPPMASATKKRPWKSKNGTAKYSARFQAEERARRSGRRDRGQRAQRGGNQAARRIVSSRKQRSMESPARNRISP